MRPTTSRPTAALTGESPVAPSAVPIVGPSTARGLACSRKFSGREAVPRLTGLVRWGEHHAGPTSMSTRSADEGARRVWLIRAGGGGEREPLALRESVVVIG